MTRLDFQKWCKDQDLENTAYSTFPVDREAWKDFAKEMNSQHPDLVKKKPKGNGTHTDILGYHFQSTSSYCLVIYANDGPDGPVSFSMYYNQVRTIDIDEATGLIIINDRIAIK